MKRPSPQRPMLRRALIRALVVFACACVCSCDVEKEGSASSFSAGTSCALGTDAEVAAAADIYLLPTLDEAKRMATAEKNRHQGTINLLLAKYSARKAPAGSGCQVLEASEEFVNVRAQATSVSGWLPLSQLREAKQ